MDVYYNNNHLKHGNGDSTSDEYNEGISEDILNTFQAATFITERTDSEFLMKKKANTFSSVICLDIKQNLVLPTPHPAKPYLSIHAITPYAPFEVAAGGIAQGKNMLRLVIDCDSDEEMELSLEVICEQETHIAWLNGSQRERIKDPCYLFKLEDGRKILEMVLHPGREVHSSALIMKDSPKRRMVYALLGKYPNWVEN
jgi:hypothetical protein